MICVLSALGLTMRPPAATPAALATTVAQCAATAKEDRLLRVTVSDVATASGIDLSTARAQLADLSAEIHGSSMEVSRSGVMVYAFPSNVAKQAARIQAAGKPERLLLSKLRAAAQACIGLLLLTSVASVRPLIDRRVWSDTRSVSVWRELQALREDWHDGPASDTSLSRACYGLMFGEDGGSLAVAAEQREAQYAGIANMIRASKGAVCADQLRPFLFDRPPKLALGTADDASSCLRTIDDWVVPILARFDGQPSVSDDGEIVFIFPELLPTTTFDKNYGLYPTSAPLVKGATRMVKSLAGPRRGEDYLEEPYRRFLVRGDARQIFAVALANWLAVLVLGLLLGPWQLGMRQLRSSAARSALGAINVAYGALLVNGFSWVVLPAVRRVRLWGYNFGVRRRNRLRRSEAARLNDPLQPAPLRRRLEAARKFGTRGRLNVRAGSEALYTTAKSLLEQAETQDPLGSAWDKKLRELTE